MPQSALKPLVVQPTDFVRHAAAAKETRDNCIDGNAAKPEASARPREHLNKHSNSKPAAEPPRARRRRPRLTTASK